MGVHEHFLVVSHGWAGWAVLLVGWLLLRAARQRRAPPRGGGIIVCCFVPRMYDDDGCNHCIQSELSKDCFCLLLDKIVHFAHPVAAPPHNVLLKTGGERKAARLKNGLKGILVSTDLPQHLCPYNTHNVPEYPYTRSAHTHTLSIGTHSSPLTHPMRSPTHSPTTTSIMAHTPATVTVASQQCRSTPLRAPHPGPLSSPPLPPHIPTHHNPPTTTV